MRRIGGWMVERLMCRVEGQVNRPLRRDAIRAAIALSRGRVVVDIVRNSVQ